ncbi:MAG: GNAT family N-acetyltransferase [Lachnospiraceae bacterium]|nr:GNAT family N-acetyltransferase [Lachnospiraceae bacterium]
MLNHKGTININTDRLLLRKFNIDDVETIYYTWASDKRVAKYTSWHAHENIDDTRAYVGYMVGKNSLSDYNWIIELDNKVIGSINVCYSDEETEIAGIAYLLAYKYWGYGYITEAAKAVIEFLFNSVQYRKIIAGCDSENIASCKVLEKIGMKREAVFREHIKRKDGSWGDDIQYGLLKQDVW